MKTQPGIPVIGEQLELFPGIEIAPIKKEENPSANDPNPMVRSYGPAKCKTCKHLFAKRWDKTYNKCALRGNTNGAGTDHRVRWKACAKYEEE
jgi:hypothetical protein